MPAMRLELALPVLDGQQRGHHRLALVVGALKRYCGLGIFSSTPSCVVPSQKIVSARASSTTGPSARRDAGRDDALHAVDLVLLHQLAGSARWCPWAMVSSSMTSSILRPAMPPAALKRSTAHSWPRRPLCRGSPRCRSAAPGCRSARLGLRDCRREHAGRGSASGTSARHRFQHFAAGDRHAPAPWSCGSSASQSGVGRVRHSDLRFLRGSDRHSVGSRLLTAMPCSPSAAH